MNIPCKQKFFCEKACFHCMSETVSLSLVMQQKYTLFLIFTCILNESAIWLFKRNYKICKYIAKFNTEHADLVVSQ